MLSVEVGRKQGGTHNRVSGKLVGLVTTSRPASAYALNYIMRANWLQTDVSPLTEEF
jgi:hypothetical protein